VGAGTGLRVVENRLDEGRAAPTGAEELIECGLVVRSIGYRGQVPPSLPFDARRGLIRNVAGRVVGDDGGPLRGEYTVGWIKRGPSGIIGTNKRDSAETTAAIVADAQADRLNDPPQPANAHGVEAWLRARVAGLVTWSGWQAIDAHETAAGGRQERPRVKLVRVPEMVAIAEGRGARSWSESVTTRA
jgi:ferredoxin/flavodoxin---NADP+ reductase